MSAALAEAELISRTHSRARQRAPRADVYKRQGGNHGGNVGHAHVDDALFNEVGVADGGVPVSYTHLDVYKRQVPLMPSSLM